MACRGTALLYFYTLLYPKRDIFIVVFVRALNLTEKPKMRRPMLPGLNNIASKPSLYLGNYIRILRKNDRRTTETAISRCRNLLLAVRVTLRDRL
jgi:hypothetical protein